MSGPPKVCSHCGESYGADVIFCPQDGTPLGSKKTEIVDDPYLDLQLLGQFRIERLIGIGAMGRVYRARQAGIDRDVAVKILHRELMMNRQLIARFHREAKVASRLAHPNVVQVLMTGEVERAADAEIGGEAFLAMEYLDGISLRSALAAAGGALPLPRALHVILQVCDAVGEAHAQGIVHRDLKPENVMLVTRGDDTDFVKVLDFGVARMDWADSEVATQAGAIFGTARYISPEGAEGGPATARSDVYSIATLLYECLAGRTPFDGDSPVSILVKQTSEPVPPLRSVPRASYVPEPIARVVEANLAKQPEDRCRGARELGRAIVEAARTSGLSPDDLLLSSTLVGSSRALQLESIQRTKTLALSADLADQMAGRRAPPSATTVVDGSGSTSEGVDPTLTDEPASAMLTARDSAPPRTPTPHRGSTPPPSGPARSSRPPAADLVRSSRPPAADPTRPSGPPPSWNERTSGPSPSWDERASGPPPSWDERASAPSMPELRASFASVPPSPRPVWSRGAFIATCFVLGAALSVGVAAGLGAFEDPEPTARTYADRARAAMAESAWDAPPGENVVDITDAALQRWPRAPVILGVRRDAANELADRADGLREREQKKANELVQLALRLDPENRRARAVLDALTPPPTAVEPEAPPDVVEDPAAPPRSPTIQPATPTVRPVPAPATPASPGVGTPPDAGAAPPSATKPGGRWL